MRKIISTIIIAAVAFAGFVKPVMPGGSFTLDQMAALADEDPEDEYPPPPFPPGMPPSQPDTIPLGIFEYYLLENN